MSTSTIELVGPYTARHLETGLEVDMGPRRNRGTTKSAIGPLCRKLIEAGHDPEQRMHIIRKALNQDGYIPVFKRDRTLKAWADVDCIETEARGPHVTKHRPLSVAVIARNPQETLKVTQGVLEKKATLQIGLAEPRNIAA